MTSPDPSQPSPPPASRRSLGARLKDAIFGAPVDRPETFGERAARAFFSLHLWGLLSLAFSNVSLGAALLCAPRRMWNDLRAWSARSRDFLPLGLYVVGMLASVLLSADFSRSTPQLTELFNLATFPLAVWLLRERSSARSVIDGLVVMGTVFALFGLAQYLVDYGDIERRIRGPFSHYMTFAGVLLICSGLVLARLATSDGVRPGWRSPWRWAAFLLMQWGLWGSLTRSAWVAAAAVVTVVVLVRRRRLLLAYLPAVALFVALAPLSWVQRGLSIVDLSDPSNYDRICMARAGAPDVGGTAVLRHRRRPGQAPLRHLSRGDGAAFRGAAPAQCLLCRSPPNAAWSRWSRSCGSSARAWSPRCVDCGGKGECADRAPTSGWATILAITAFCVAGLFENNWGDTEVQRVFLFALALPVVLKREDHATGESSESAG